MKELKDKSDIKYLVDSFYERVLKDEVIGFYFVEVVVLNFEKHLPVMYDFWESALFHTGSYKGNPMIKHLNLHDRMAIDEKHFDRWLSLWEQTVEENFSGSKAEEAVEKANQIASLMKHKIEQSERIKKAND